MKTIALAAVGILFTVAACSKAPECTAETLAKKAQDVTVALQEAIVKEPAKAAEFSAKVQEVATKYQGNSAEDACKAYDELLSVLKG